MNDSTLDKLVEDGQISSYVYEDISDTNRNGDILYYERLIITFNDGSKIQISPSGTGDLSIYRG